MISCYLDTNVFLYASDSNSPFFYPAQAILGCVAAGTVRGHTSFETIQEIVFYFQKKKEQRMGLSVAEKLMTIIPEPLAIDRSVISEYLSLLSKYPKTLSRDLIHLASARVHRIHHFATADTGFKQFREIAWVGPKEWGSIGEG